MRHDVLRLVQVGIDRAVERARRLGAVGRFDMRERRARR